MEGGQGVDGEKEDFSDGEEAEAEAKGVATAVGEEKGDRPEEIKLLFHSEGPEVVEGERGGIVQTFDGEVREVLEKKDEDEEGLELSKCCAG